MATLNDLLGKWVQAPIQNQAIDGASLDEKKASLQEITRLQNKAFVLTPPGAAGGRPVMGGHRPTMFSYTGLEYVAGLVTACPTGTAVMTGWMSGCFLFRFKLKGRLMVAHVGTEVNNEEKSAIARRMWVGLMANPEITEVVGCNPAKQVSMEALRSATTQGLVPQIAGFYEPNGSARILTFGIPQKEAMTMGGASYLKLLHYGTMPLEPWSALKNDVKFKDP